MFDVDTFVASCLEAVRQPGAGARVKALMEDLLKHPPEELARALAPWEDVKSLEDMAFYRSDELTLLHVVFAPGFEATPHNHNMWALVGVYAGQEDNTLYRRAEGRLVETGRSQIRTGEAFLLGSEAIHAIRNNQDTELRAVHAYGGDLLKAVRSSWNPETWEESVFDWQEVGPVDDA